MKKGILFLLVVIAAGSYSARAQSLKQLLYSGKLKNDSNTVVRKTDDLKSKIDTGQRKPAEPEKTVIAVIPADSAVRIAKTDSAVAGKDVATTGAVVKDSAEPPVAQAEAEVKPTPTPVKSNSKIWKEYTDSLISSLKAEVLTSKKIKKETYYILVEYELETDGQVNITNVTSTPENALLQAQIKERLMVSPPKLSPMMDSNNQARKVKRKQNFTVTKE